MSRDTGSTPTPPRRLAPWIAGMALGCAATLLLMKSREAPLDPSPLATSAETAPAALERQLAIVLERLEALDVGIRRLTRQVEAAREPLSASGTPATHSEPEPPVREKAEPLAQAPAKEKDKPRVENALWIDAIDKDVARVLVERGFTPFDPGVAVPVRDACAALREVEASYQVGRAPYADQLLSGQMQVKAFQDATKPFDARRSEGRQTILDRLAAALDQLLDARAAKPGDGK